MISKETYHLSNRSLDHQLDIASKALRHVAFLPHVQDGYHVTSSEGYTASINQDITEQTGKRRVVFTLEINEEE